MGEGCEMDEKKPWAGIVIDKAGKKKNYKTHCTLPPPLSNARHGAKKCGPSTPWALDTPQFFSRRVRSGAKKCGPPGGGRWTPPGDWARGGG